MPIKPKLTFADQINYMKNIKGIAFNHITETDAQSYLERNNYYFRIKSYAKNYAKDSNDKYQFLDFAYLKELSRLDADLRRVVLQISIDLEHYAKVKLIEDASKNPHEDGYTTIADFLSKYTTIKDRIIRDANSSTSYCSPMIQKYHADLAIWNIVEILTFHEFHKLYDFYYQKHNGKKEVLSSFLYSIRLMRNATAHNNCLLHTITKPLAQVTITSPLANEVYRILKITGYANKAKRDNIKKLYLSNRIVHDLLSVIYAAHKFLPSGSRRTQHFANLKEAFYNNKRKRIRFFRKNVRLYNTFKFIKTVIDTY